MLCSSSGVWSCAPVLGGVPLVVLLVGCPGREPAPLPPVVLLWGVVPAAGVFRPLGNPESELVSAPLCAP